MAYIGQTSIRCDTHMDNAIQYITKEEKAFSLEEMKKHLDNRLNHLSDVNSSVGEKATYLNCSSKNTYKDFENMRRAFDQDKGVIAHHYYQSFQKDDNVTPEQAHKIGVELAKKMFPNYQVVVSTHIDREHLHNHIIVNSCNIVTGQKWHSNKKSLAEIRKESDKLCLANGLGVITKESKFKGIDRTTYQLGLKGKSWKINLVRDLEKAVECCKSKEEFISFMEKKDNTVRYTDSHITLTKNGEKKGIRVDTLAKTFGDKFTKENLEKKMGYFRKAEIKPKSELNTSAPVKKKKTSPEVKSNWEYYEQQIFKRNNYLPSAPARVVRDQRAIKCSRVSAKSLLYSRNIFDFVIRCLILLLSIRKRKNYNRNYKKRKQVYYKKVQTVPKQQTYEYINFGNIRYNELTTAAGQNYSVKVTLDKLLLLVNQPILFSGRIDKNNNSVTITVKAKDKNFLGEILNLQSKQAQLDEQSEKIENRKTYNELKEIAEQSNTKLNYLLVTAEQMKILKENYIQFTYFEKGDKLNIAFLPEKAELIKKLIYPAEKKKAIETPQQKNNRIYAQLKKQAALNGEKLSFRTKLTKEQLDNLTASGVTFACFTNSDDKSLYNIAYEKKDDDNIKKVLQTGNTIKR